MKQLSITPPLLNTPCPWCSELDDLRQLYASPSTGAITTRTSMLTPYPHDWAIHQYVLFDPSTHQTASVNTQDATPNQTASLNTIGLSPNDLDTTIGFVTTLSDDLQEGQPIKPIIVSVAGTPADVATAYQRLNQTQKLVKMPLAMEINLSCPNLPGEVSPAYSAKELLPYLTALQDQILALYGQQTEEALPIGIKTPPFTYADQYHELLTALVAATTHPDYPKVPLAFITTTNTLGSSLILSGETPKLNSANSQGLGGMAGTALHPLSLGNVFTIRHLLNQHDQLAHLQLIGVGGVSDRAGFKRMQAVGADFVGLATALGAQGIEVFDKILAD